MKKIYFTLSFIIASGMLSAQNSDTKRADKFFDKYNYTAAAEEYLRLVDNKRADSYVYTQLADSYYGLYNPTEAVKWYAKATEETQGAEVYFKYAQMLKATGDYKAADKQMAKFASLAPKDDRAKEFLNRPTYLTELQNQAKLYSIVESDISSDKSDFGAVLTNTNDFYFTSARNKSRKRYVLNKQPFLDVYKATYTDGTLSEPTLVDGVNSKWHDGPVALTADGNTMYFASESFNGKLYLKGKNKDKYGQLNLFKASFQDGEWGNIIPLSINSKEYSVSAPSVSKDGKTLYFSSNMPGSLGGFDIWKVSINGNDLGTPVNMGAKINTSGNEGFPFITDDNVMFFSSDGHPGFGGLDIYKVENNGEVMNVGVPVNSAQDDFSFSFNKAKKTGYFSSNRSGVDNIYIADPVCNVMPEVYVINEMTNTAVDGAVVTLLNEKDRVVGTQNSAANGKANFTAECDKTYTVQVTKPGFESGSFVMNKSEGGVVAIQAPLKPITPIITEKEVILDPIYFEFDKSAVTESGAVELDKLVKVMNEMPEMVIFVKSHTDNKGSDVYNKQLSARRAKATVAYVVSKGIAKERITGEGFGESELKEVCEPCTAEQDAVNRRSEFLIVKK